MEEDAVGDGMEVDSEVEVEDMEGDANMDEEEDEPDGANGEGNDDDERSGEVEDIGSGREYGEGENEDRLSDELSMRGGEDDSGVLGGRGEFDSSGFEDEMAGIVDDIGENGTTRSAAQ